MEMMMYSGAGGAFALEAVTAVMGQQPEAEPHCTIPASKSGVHPAHAKWRLSSPRSPAVRGLIAKGKRVARKAATAGGASPRLRVAMSSPRATAMQSPRTRALTGRASIYAVPHWHFY